MILRRSDQCQSEKRNTGKNANYLNFVLLPQ